MNSIDVVAVMDRYAGTLPSEFAEARDAIAELIAAGWDVYHFGLTFRTRERFDAAIARAGNDE